MNIHDILTSKNYVKEHITFPEPQQYISRFLDIVDTDDVIVKVDSKVINANTDNSINIAYGRVNVEYRQQFATHQNYTEVLGLIYALDMQIPQIIAYSGINCSACTNLHIFGAENVMQINLMGDNKPIYDMLAKEFNRRDLRFEEDLNIIERLRNKQLNDIEIQRILGELLLFATRKNGKIPSTVPTGTARLLQDKSSIYYGNQETDLYNMYNAGTQILTDMKDIIGVPVKTVQLSNFYLSQFRS